MKKCARFIAFYLPQFHPIPENDRWWGAGFTEWVNTAKARPLFRGHEQPRLPGELGFYDLRLEEVKNAQAELAKAHGIEGFCYWHYWFAGKRLIERPFLETLMSGRPDFPFCLGWANESWSGVWHGRPDEILMEQTYPGKKDFEAHFNAVLPAFKDRRYIHVGKKPLFVLHRPELLPSCRAFVRLWQGLAQKNGLKGIYFVGTIHDPRWDGIKNGLDGVITNAPGFYLRRLPLGRYRYGIHRLLRRPTVFSYKSFVRHALRSLGEKEFPVVMPGWDNTPRCGKRGIVFRNSTPQLFERHLRQAVRLLEGRPQQERLVFIKSWNEWAEGNYLEPDRRFGRAYLEAVRNVSLA